MSTTGQDDIGANQVVRRKNVSRAEQTVTAAKSEPGHTNPVAIRRHGYQTVRSRGFNDIDASRSARNGRSAGLRIYLDSAHLGEIDNETVVAQSTAGAGPGKLD